MSKTERVLDDNRDAELAEAHFFISIMQEALEHIASDTEECRQQVAQETLEALAVPNGDTKDEKR